jgi:Tfp pilus assembly protein PilO
MKILTRQRRKSLMRIAERLAVAAVVLDVVFYFAAFRPVRRARDGAIAAFTKTRLDIIRDQSRIEQLQKVKQNLPEAQAAFDGFMKDHVPSRRRGFSEAMSLFQKLTQDAGVQMIGISYKTSKATTDPLERLGIQVEVDGTFPQLLKFAHAVETQNDFIVLRSFGFEMGDNDAISMRLGTDLYLSP